MDTPLALMLKTAEEAPPSKSLRIFKTLGDTSLYFAGFFQDFFKSKTYNVDYYMSMGSTAYNRVSDVMKSQHGDSDFASMYRDLSSQFDNLVDIVSEVSDSRPITGAIDLLSVYENWLETRSPNLLKILEDAGFTPPQASLKNAV